MPASALASLPPALGEQVQARARALQQAAHAGAPSVPLKGKYLGLISEHPESAAAQLFTAAAAGLGAQVSQIRPSVARLGAADDIEQAALWMGRLYDAIECQGLPPDIVRRIQAAAGVPVFDGLAASALAHAGRLLLADAQPGDGEGRLYLLQAVLLDLVALMDR